MVICLAVCCNSELQTGKKMSDLFFFKRKTAYEILRSDWSSDVCSSDPATTRTSRRFARRSSGWKRKAPGGSTHARSRCSAAGMIDRLPWPAKTGKDGFEFPVSGFRKGKLERLEPEKPAELCRPPTTDH